MTDGLVVVDKPSGWTSHDVVAKLRGVYRQRRIGHAGTLDPAATGVLLVGLGRATRLLRFLQDAGKDYRGTVAFGITTDTLDADGAVLERAPLPVQRADVEAAARRFEGEVLQVPPMVSARKVGGRRLHELAREGKEVEREARPVRIERLLVEDFTPGPYPTATIFVSCSSGTYVRTLAADLGAALGGGAHLAALRRLRVDGFTLDDAHTLAAIEAAPDAAVVAPSEAMRSLERVVVDDDVARAVSHGTVLTGGALDVDGRGPLAIMDRGGALLAVYERTASACRPLVVLASGMRVAEPGSTE